MSHRSWQIASFVSLAFIAAVLAWAASEIIPRSRYGYAARRINAKIGLLGDRRPADVSEKVWEQCVAWASIAFCNVCASEGHTPYTEMSRLEHDLDEKVKGPVDVSTLKWIGERVAQTGPNGERYMVKMGWREQWERIFNAPSE